jgi:hypothetical protein
VLENTPIAITTTRINNTIAIIKVVLLVGNFIFISLSFLFMGRDEEGVAPLLLAGSPDPLSASLLGSFHLSFRRRMPIN